MVPDWTLNRGETSQRKLLGNQEIEIWIHNSSHNYVGVKLLGCDTILWLEKKTHVLRRYMPKDLVAERQDV